MKRALVMLVLVGVLAACGGDSGSGDESVDRAVERMEEMMAFQAKGQYSRSYAMIHPAQRDIMSQADYEICVQSPVDIEIQDVKLDEYYTEQQFEVPGTGLTTEALALTVGIKARMGGFEQETVETFRAIDVDGEWLFTYDAGVIACASAGGR